MYILCVKKRDLSCATIRKVISDWNQYTEKNEVLSAKQSVPSISRDRYAGACKGTQYQLLSVRICYTVTMWLTGLGGPVRALSQL